ncbi:MAG: glyoxalase [Limimaricola sp.]|uniref:VOC family protein n=1 Tax=Limimaricola sp. TaxID=2211665 RepID=UPI001D37ED42|nr:glyoxalase [Limimaricola sp.]MBI1416121.1 glyoxalase [Limimaricola sp.]
MDYETVSAEDFGRALHGLGLNLLVRDVRRQVAFLSGAFAMTAHRVSPDFAILRYGTALLQLHADATYHAHPLPSLLPEAGARGAGIELRLFETDPDIAAERAEALGGTLLQPPTNKPHGLRECVILCENGYAWVPSRPIPAG